MLIEIHAVQNHAPGNLNRDDLGAPKTCYFGGVLRSRISSQCIKRSIRTSEGFRELLGSSVRTRRLARRIAAESGADPGIERRAQDILDRCGFPVDAKESKKDGNGNGDEKLSEKSKSLIFLTPATIKQMAKLMTGSGKKDSDLPLEFGNLIVKEALLPDMALSGRMLEPRKDSRKGVWNRLDNPNVEASLQVAHAISTHAARPEVDYFVAADDVPGDDAGAGFVDEAMFASACFYKYFSVNWEQLVKNLRGNEQLAAHTVGAFLRGAASVNPTGKQNSFAAHNLPDGILIEIRKNGAPVSYANAFAKPTEHGSRALVSQSIAQLGQYVHDIDVGYGKPDARLWFSPNLRFPLTVQINETVNGKERTYEEPLSSQNLGALTQLIESVIRETGHDWAQVQKIILETQAVA